MDKLECPCSQCGCLGNNECGHESPDEENGCALDPVDLICPCCEAKNNKIDEKRMLLNLLAIIHGDGGHYTGNNGLKKSYEDAITKFHESTFLNMEFQEMIKIIPCNCDEAYKNRNLTRPDCPRCNYVYDIDLNGKILFKA